MSPSANSGVNPPSGAKPPAHSRSALYLWVLIAIIAGGTFGILAPDQAVKLKFVAEAFVQAIKIIVIPIIFCTVALGVSGAGGLRRAGRLGLKAILYFEIVSTFALILGLCVANIFKPGLQFPHPAQIDPLVAQEYLLKAENSHWLLSLFTSGGMLPILAAGLITGFLIKPQARVRLDWASKLLFKFVDWVMKLAPIAAGSAMAFTLGKYGLISIVPLMSLMLCFYLTCGLFVFGVLGLIARYFGFSLWKLMIYLKEELLTVLGTSSSESVLASLIEKLERAGCDRATVGLVIPTGYSFNLDGTSIYITLAGLFIAQAMGVDLTLAQQLAFLGVAILTSKGAAGVTGSGFVTLAATLAVFPSIPATGLALILGVDRFMSEARALTNVMGNAVAAVVMSRSENRSQNSDTLV